MKPDHCDRCFESGNIVRTFKLVANGHKCGKCQKFFHKHGVYTHKYFVKRAPSSTPRCEWCRNSAGKIHGPLVDIKETRTGRSVKVHVVACLYRFLEKNEQMKGMAK